MYSRTGINAYANIEVESAVLSASPWQLVNMLFDGALSALKRAQIFTEHDDIAGKGQALSKAINIISNGLQSGLDFNVNRELCENLDNLYSYMTRRLLQANLHNDPSAIAEVHSLLSNISDAWKEIAPHSSKANQDNY
ncbi:flagellar export chaperone FliS [Pseudenterobacter timonensis]|uniref:Flagellar secretion chaperone FliS n=1 Tax=Pseudenterobacter timonensis TaxID=1755099 RepID=A0ABV4A4Q4_9ENTR